MRRVIFVNLHGNEFLVKTINKIIFKQSVAVKHRYLLNYLLDREDIEDCIYRAGNYSVYSVLRGRAVACLSFYFNCEKIRPRRAFPFRNNYHARWHRRIR